MSLETNLKGRLRNTHLPNSNGLLPLFEAVVNSIHSIDDADLPSGEGRIVVQIERSREEQLTLEKEAEDAAQIIVGFRISDNGIGFNEANMASFRTLDSEHKVNRGGRGVGRLLWLKAFEEVDVRSCFDDMDRERKVKAFTFNDELGVEEKPVQTADAEAERKTTVHLKGFVKRYRKATYKTASAIANSLLEHCLWYFILPDSVPKILIRDREESIDLDSLYGSYILDSSTTETIGLKDEQFQLTHTRLRASANRPHTIGLCAANRLVTEEKLSGKIAGLFGKLQDGDSEFIYACYVTSPFLDKRVRSERTAFNIPDSLEPLFAAHDVCLSDIREMVVDKASKYLESHLDKNKRLSEERIRRFVCHEAPRYRPVLPRMQLNKLVVDPSISDKDLELTLHKELSKIEAKMLDEGHELMKPHIEEKFEDYKERLQKYLDTAKDIKESDLANYVFHRKVILDLLANAIKQTHEGKYAREDLIHTLLMPMQTDSNEVKPGDCNLWLIDERLAFHDYLASDKPLSAIPITGATENKRPDIAALNVFSNPLLVSEGTSLPLASIVVVELKRPMRNDAKEGEEKDPIAQALGYLARIRKGKVTTSQGRMIPQSESIPGFCYILCDITPSVEERCNMHDATPTSDGLGYFFYHKKFKAYVEIVSFDRLINSARERNRAFFDQLGLPTT